MQDKLKELRKLCLRISCKGQDGNLQSVFSSMEILWAIYHKVMNWTPAIAAKPDRDYFFLSKGQSTMGLHVVLSELGLYPKEDLKTFCQFHSRYSMQADRTKFPEGGIENSSGSLGHGFPMAVGLAMAKNIQGRNNHIYVLAGDGEMNEGTMWESMALASSHHLKRLCLIIDDNDSIGRMIHLGDLAKKAEAFGFLVDSCDGHSVEGIADSIANLQKKAESEHMPMCLIAKTIRGYGSKTLMEDRSWFHRAPQAHELTGLLQEVDAF